MFETLGGFDDALGVDLNDIDYCLRAQRSGLQVLYEANAELIHHESPSRGFAGSTRDIIKFIERWKASILSGRSLPESPSHTDGPLVRATRSRRRPMVAAMVRGLHEKLSNHLPPSAPSDDETPRMFKRSADLADPLRALRHGAEITKLHREWLIRIVPPKKPTAGQRGIRVVRRVLNRWQSVDREIIADVIRAIDALALRCDELADRLEHQRIVLDDAVTILGEEVTRVRAASGPLADGDVRTVLPSSSHQE